MRRVARFALLLLLPVDIFIRLWERKKMGHRLSVLLIEIIAIIHLTSLIGTHKPVAPASMDAGEARAAAVLV